MELADYLARDRVIEIRGSTKREAIAELIDAAMASCAISDRRELEWALLHREELMSTGIGLGIGVPHARLDSIERPCVAVGIHRTGLRDYEAIDGKPVQIVVLILAGKGQHALYIRLLAAVTSLLKVAAVRERLIAAKDTAEAFEILTGAKGS